MGQQADQTFRGVISASIDQMADRECMDAKKIVFAISRGRAYSGRPRHYSFGTGFDSRLHRASFRRTRSSVPC